jgi:hypothetical protein
MTADPIQPSPADRPPAGAADKRDTPWYKDPPRLVGVLGFALAFATLGERALVRESELTAQRMQQLRDVTGQLADIQNDYLEAVEKNPTNLYLLGTAKNTKRQMLLQTADALLGYAKVRQQASAQIYGALASEALSDGRYERSRTYFERALEAPGTDDSVKPFILRSLGMLYRVPGTPISDPKTAARYFVEARSVFEKRADDAARLSWAETVLTEANVELTYGNTGHAKELAAQAQARIATVKVVSPVTTQLVRWAAAVRDGQQFGQPHEAAASDAAMPVSPGLAEPSAARSPGVSEVGFELWPPIAGQPSGAELTLHVDGRDVGRLSNLGQSRRLVVKGLSNGPHRLALSIAKVYFMDPANGPSPVGGDLRCETWFEVKAREAILELNVANGFNGLVCGAR